MTSSIKETRSATPAAELVTFPAWPVFDDDEIEAATSVLKSGKVNYWTGDSVGNFEEAFAQYVSCRHAIAVANGTLALELALYALGIGEGDEVIVPSRTFIATASAVVLRGAIPVVADIERDSQNLSAETIEPLLTNRTRAIIAVHLSGWPCDMDSITRLARARGIFVIEDCAQAVGARYKGRAVGSLGDVAAFSFCQDKIMTTAGEGGMVTTNDSKLWQRAWSYKDHGKNFQKCTAKPTPGFRWVHDEFGTNWRLTAIQAAVGQVQLSKVDEWVERRRANATILDEGFSTISGLRTSTTPPNLRHAYYKHYAYVIPRRLAPGWNRDRIMLEINAASIPCGQGVCSEIYREQAFASVTGETGVLCPVAAELGETSLMFLVHPTLDATHMQKTVQTVRRIMSEATTR
jgi:dTDP-4-amino-4,6-dideoxygalactose transaminase